MRGSSRAAAAVGEGEGAAVDDAALAGRADRRLITLGAAITAASSVVFTWMLTVGRGDLLARRGFSDVFDLQARSMLDGRLDVPSGSLGFEGFVLDDRTYTYLGVFPSLLRVPLQALTDAYDGRVTGPSMLLAYLVAMVSATLVVDRVRPLLGRDAPWTRPGLALAGVAVAVVGVGSNLTFLASAAWAYHEASIWGTAGALAAAAVLLAHLREPRPRRILLAGLWTAVAWLSRGTMGLAPSIALAAAGLAQLSGVPALRSLAPAGSPGRRAGAGLIAAAVVPATLFAVVNLAKFDTVASVPWPAQTLDSPTREAALDRYDGSLFSATLVPSTSWQTVRPDLVSTTTRWPLVTFTRKPPIEVGDPVFDVVEPSAGMTSTMPLLVVLAAAGIASLLRRDPGVGVRRAALLPLVAGAAVAGAVPFTIAFVAQRYQTDLMPLLVLTVAVAVAGVDRRCARRPPRRLVASVGVVGVVALATVGTWTTLSVTWLHQRFEAPPDRAATAAGLRTQARLGRLPGLAAVRVLRVDRLPETWEPGEVAIVGRCLAVYRAQGDGWNLVEASAAGGRYELRVTWPDERPRAPEVVARLGRGPDAVSVTLGRDADGAVVVGLDQDGGSSPYDLAPAQAGRVHDLLVTAVTPGERVIAAVGGRVVAVSHRPGPQPASLQASEPGRGPRVEVVTSGTPTCQALLETATEG